MAKRKIWRAGWWIFQSIQDDGAVIKRLAVTIWLRILMAGVVLMIAGGFALAQVGPLAPRWLAGTPPPPVETFADGLERHHIAIDHHSLVAALESSDGEVRSLAAAQLAAMDDHAALKDIVRAFNDERDPQVQVNLAGAATWMGSHHGLQQLERMCQDMNVPSLSRLDAARYVSNKGEAACIRPVREIAARDQDPEVRALAVTAAARYRGQRRDAPEVAEKALQDTDPGVRIAAGDALRTLRATDSIGAIDRALKNEGDERVRAHLRQAKQALERRPDARK